MAELDRGAGALAAAAARLEAAIGRAGDGVVRAERLSLLAVIDEARGDIAAARARVAEARAGVAGAGPGADAGSEAGASAGSSESAGSAGASAAAARIVELGLRRHEGWLLYRDGDCDAAVACFEALIDEVPDEASELRGLVLIGLGVATHGQGDGERAQRAFRQALALFEARGDLRRAAACYNNLGMVAHRQGDVRGAVRWYEQALGVHARRGDRSALAQAYNNLGSMYGDIGEYERAAQYLEEVIRIRSRAGHAGLALGYANLGEVRQKQGRLSEAREHLERAIALCEEGRGPGYLVPDARRMLAELHLGSGAPAEAAAEARAALSWAEERGDRPRAGAASRVLGEALAALGETGEAEARLAGAVEVLEALDQPIELARAYAAQARFLAQRGDAGAAALAARAEALFAAVRG